MRTRQGRRRPFGRLALVAATALTCAYFAHHATSGPNGWHAREARLAQLDRLRGEVVRLAQVRADAEARNRLINGVVVERDVVDERARAMLGVARADEIIVLMPSEG